MGLNTNKSILITPGTYGTLSTSLSQIDFKWYNSGVGTFAFYPTAYDLRSTIYNWVDNCEPVLLLGGIGTINNQQYFVGPYPDYIDTFTGLSSDPSIKFYPISGSTYTKNISVSSSANFYQGINISSIVQTNITSMSQYGQGFVGSYYTNSSSWNGNGFAFNNSNVGSKTLGLVVNDDTLFFGSVHDADVFLQIDSNDAYLNTNLHLNSYLADEDNSFGNPGQVLSSTATGTAWTSLSSVGFITGSGTVNYLTKWSSVNSITDSIISDDGYTVNIQGSLNVSGFVTSVGFYGPGTNITNLNASNLASGTVPSAVVSGAYSGITSVGTLSQLNVSGFVTSVGFYGPGTNITNLNASNLASGTVPSAVVSGAYSGITSVGTLSQLNVSGITTASYFYGDGSNITNLNASNLASGTVPSSVVSGDYSGITSVGTLSQLNVSGFVTSAGFYGPGTNITRLNASNLVFGTVPLGRLSGTYSGITSVGTLSQLNVSGFVTSAGFYGPGPNITNLNASNLASGTVPSARISGGYTGITQVGSLTGVTTVSSLNVSSAFYDTNSSSGTSGQILTSNGTNVTWSSAQKIGVITGFISANQVAYGSASSTITGSNSLWFNGTNFGIGTNAPTNVLTVVGGDAIINTVSIGLGTGQTATNLMIGANGPTVSVSSLTNSVIIGYGAAQNVGSGANTLVAIGPNSLWNSAGTNLVAIGSSAGQYFTASGAVLVGTNAGSGSATTSITLVGKVFVGQNAGQYADGTGQIAIGRNALQGSATGAFLTGGNTIAIGGGAGQFLNATGIVIGQSSLAGSATTYVTGSNNIVLGGTSGNKITSGSNNIIIGYAAGQTPTTGGQNVFIGQGADGADANRQIAIGQNVVTTGANLGAWGGTSNAARTDLGLGTFTPLARFHTETINAANKGVYIAGAASQTGNLLQIDATTSGTNYVTVTGVGSVGINQASPTQLFHVQGNMRLTGAHFDSNNSAGASGTILTSTVTGTAWSTAVQLGIVTGTGAATQIAYWNTANQLTGISTLVYSSGNVGIGTATPSQLLHVQGGFRLTGAFNDSSNSAGSNGSLLKSTATGTAWSTPVQLGLVTGTAAANQIAVWNNANQLVGFDTFVYTGVGSVGIGTATPTALLHVQDNVRITGGIYDSNNNLGLANSVLSSTGTGIAWTAAATGGGSGTIGGSIALNQVAYGSAANTIQGTSLLTYSATTGLGVNTSIALSTLHVRSNVASSSVFKVDGTAGTLFEITDQLTGTLYSFNNISGLPIMAVSDGVSSPLVYIESVVGLNSQILAVVSPSNASYFSVAASGNVGVGTSSPTQSLHVQGNVRITGGLYDSNNNIGLANSVLSSTGTGLAWTAAASGGGTGTIGGSISANQIAYGSGSNAIQGSNNLWFTGSNLGIGTSSPQAQVHNTGTERIDSTLTLNSNASDLRNQRVFIGANTSTTSTTYIGISSILVPNGYSLTIDGKANGFFSNSINEAGKFFAAFYNNGTLTQVGTSDIVSKYNGSYGNFDVQGIGSFVTIVVKSNSVSNSWYWRVGYDYLLTQNS